jgi:ABC-type sugar transport system ATPase subunit
MSEESASRFEAVGITHDYTGVVVLRDVDFGLERGAVHGLVGENGSGKSTLIKILTGALAPRAGRLLLDGEEVTLASPKAAQDHGIAVVHQDYNVFPDLTVADNVFCMHSKLPRRTAGIVDRAEVARRVRALLDELEIALAPDALVRTLGPVERKFIEIARAMLLRPRFLILDEPTASLEPRSAASVLDLIERLRAQGIGVGFVSHRLDEVLRIADRITVLRDGAVVGRLAREEATEAKLAKLIVGDKALLEEVAELAHETTRTTTGDRDVVMRIENVSVLPGAPPVSLELKRGEILGLTGLLGSGAAQLVRMLGGAIPFAGELEVAGRRVRIRNPRDASRARIGLIPEDRKSLGVIPDESVAMNISLPSLRAVSRGPLLVSSRVVRRAVEYRDKLGIRLASIHSPVRTLSGGNTQKVMIAKWLASGVQILAIEEPTHGIDIGTKGQVHALLREFAAKGGAIVVASTDVEEILSLCDSVAIFRHGGMTDLISTSELLETVAAAGAGTESQHLLERLIVSDADAA